MIAETTFTTNRLLLVPLAPEDKNFIFELVNSEEWIKYIGDRKIDSQEYAERYIQTIIGNPNINYWVVRLRSGNASIGIVTFIKREYLEVHDLGFAFLPEFTNKGFAFEATQKVLLTMISNPAYPKILATTITENTRSIKLLDKLGFRFYKEIEVNTGKLLVYEIASRIH
jgi:[ribosomal protein S5]-alanine N-acetyltransferase